MDKLEQLLAELTATDEKMDALLANDELSEDQHTEHDTLVAGRLKLTASINAERDRLKRADERKALADEAEERIVTIVEEVFASCEAHVVTFPNFYTGGESSSTVYIAKVGGGYGS